MLAWEPNEYILVYYRGRNDAWIGYGGGVLYTRASKVTPELEAKYKATWEEAVKRVGMDWSEFQYTDNACGLQPRGVVDLDVLLDGGAFLEKALGRDIRGAEESLEKLETEVESFVDAEGYMLTREARIAEMGTERDLQLLNQAVADEFGIIRDQEKKIERALAADVGTLESKRKALVERLTKKAATQRLEDMEKAMATTPSN